MMPTNPLRRPSELLPWAVVGLAGVFALRRLDNADTWWHLASGRWIVENGSVPYRDTLSFTVTDHVWINLQWLYDLVLFALYRVGQADALVGTSAVAYVTAFAIMTARVRRSLGPVATAWVGGWVLLVAQDRFAIRPEMVTFVLLQVVLALLAGARKNEGRRLWRLIPIMALWVNSHALFVVGLFLIGCALVAALLVEYVPLPRAWRDGSSFPAAARRRLLIAAGLSFAVTLVNPYFFRGVMFPFELLSRFDKASPFAEVGEFRSPFSSLLPDFTLGAYQVLLVCAVAAVLAAGLVTARPGPRRDDEPKARFDVGGLLVFAGLAWMSVLAFRNMALFALGTAPFLAQCLSILGSRPGGGRPAWLRVTGRVVAATVAVTLALGVWFVASNRYYRWLGRTHEFGAGVLEVNTPSRATEFFERFELPGPMHNDLIAGGYLTWARPNGEPVYIDGRLEVYDAFLAEYSAGMGSPDAWSGQAEALGINSVFLFHGWRNRRALIGWLDRHPEWSMVYFDEVAVIFVRNRGHEEIITEARAAFQEAYSRTLARMQHPPATRGYPLGRVVAWLSLGELFVTLGEPDRAADCFAQALDYDVRPNELLNYGLWLAAYHLDAGDTAQARQNLDRARRIDPDHPAIRNLTARLPDGSRRGPDR